MSSMRLIKPNELYAGLPQGWWLKNHWEYIYPLILRAAPGQKELPAPDENQAGPVIYAVGKYARAFAEPQTLVQLVKSELDNSKQVERHQMTNTSHKGFVLPFVKFIALESDGDGSSFDELRNVAQSLALDSDVDITFKVDGGMLTEDEKEIKNNEIHIATNDAMRYYSESFPIELPAPLYGQTGHIENHTNRAVSSAFMAIFEPQAVGVYRIDVIANYIFRFRGKNKVYGPLEYSYELDVKPPIKEPLKYEK
jgi:hypothetical protein